MSGFTPLTIGGKWAIVHLTRGLHAIIDVQDWPQISSYGKWHAHRGGPGLNKFYARTKCDGRRIFMHTVLVPGADGRSPDHQNGNRLDNRRQNLRPATHAQNMANKPTRNSTGYRGVRRQRSGGYQAVFLKQAIGTFATPQQAAAAYDREAMRRYGEFATLNFPEVVA